MRDADNIHAVTGLGISMMGFIFYPKSKRYVSSPVIKYQTPNVKRVGVFVNDSSENIIHKIADYDLDYIQLHGNESRRECETLRTYIAQHAKSELKIIKAISVSGPEDISKYKNYEGVADLLLFDTKCKTIGGSGEQFDWSVLNYYDGNTPFLLSGGIGPEDIDRLKAFQHPRCIGIDLNSRFETTPAMKDVAKLSEFISKLK